MTNIPSVSITMIEYLLIRLIMYIYVISVIINNIKIINRLDNYSNKKMIRYSRVYSNIFRD